jgi:choline kinase
VTGVNTKAIIVAAGRGRRMASETEALPKCMVRVNGRPMLHWQLAALEAAGVTDVVVVRGWRGESIDGGDYRLRFVENPGWAENNILTSLFCAADEMHEGFFFSYSDIVYTAAVTRQLAMAPPRTDVALVVDRSWHAAYQGRTEHPVSEAELVKVDGDHITCVGKRAATPEEAAGEFIGLARFSKAGAEMLTTTWARALAAGGLDSPFGRAATLRQAYLTDALQAMADAGLRVTPVYIDGNWREIDTPQDLSAAERAVLHFDGR